MGNTLKRKDTINSTEYITHFLHPLWACSSLNFQWWAAHIRPRRRSNNTAVAGYKTSWLFIAHSVYKTYIKEAFKYEVINSKNMRSRHRFVRTRALQDDTNGWSANTDVKTFRRERNWDDKALRYGRALLLLDAAKFLLSREDKHFVYRRPCKVLKDLVFIEVRSNFKVLLPRERLCACRLLGAINLISVEESWSAKQCMSNVVIPQLSQYFNQHTVTRASPRSFAMEYKKRREVLLWLLEISPRRSSCICTTSCLVWMWSRTNRSSGRISTSFLDSRGGLLAPCMLGIY